MYLFFKYTATTAIYTYVHTLSLHDALPISKGALSDGNGQARGGLLVALRSSLAGGLPGVRQWFAVYPYSCLEQLASKAIGMLSPTQWRDRKSTRLNSSH